MHISYIDWFIFCLWNVWKLSGVFACCCSVLKSLHLGSTSLEVWVPWSISGSSVITPLSTQAPPDPRIRPIYLQVFALYRWPLGLVFWIPHRWQTTKVDKKKKTHTVGSKAQWSSWQTITHRLTMLPVWRVTNLWCMFWFHFTGFYQ